MSVSVVTTPKAAPAGTAEDRRSLAGQLGRGRFRDAAEMTVGEEQEDGLFISARKFAHPPEQRGVIAQHLRRHPSRLEVESQAVEVERSGCR